MCSGLIKSRLLQPLWRLWLGLRSLEIYRVSVVNNTINTNNFIILHGYAATCFNYYVVIFRAFKYRVIHKSLRDFRPLRYSSRDGHAEGEHVNRGRDTPNFCPTLQVLDISALGDAAVVNPVIKFLPHTLHMCGRNLITGLTSAASPRAEISRTY